MSELEWQRWSLYFQREHQRREMESIKTRLGR
jgi:hypothetical protein